MSGLFTFFPFPLFYSLFILSFIFKRPRLFPLFGTLTDKLRRSGVTYVDHSV